MDIGCPLNSSVTSFYIKQRYASASYNGGISFTHEMLNNLPIPDGLDANLLAASARDAVAARTEMIAITAEVHGAVRASGAQAIRRNLNAWHALTASSFIAELARHGLNVPVTDRVQWAELLASRKAAFVAPHGRWKVANEAIDQELIRAYSLGRAEAELIERSWDRV